MDENCVLQKEVRSPILDLRKAIKDFLEKEKISSYLVLGSRNTIQNGLYQFDGIKSYIPNKKEVEMISKTIFEYNLGIKNSDQVKKIREICSFV